VTQRSVSHTSFVIERDFAAPPRTVFRAWSDPDAKRRWSDCHSDMAHRDYSLDFRPGGSEMNRLVTPDGAMHLVQGHFFDIVADERIIYAYHISVGERRLSASLVTVQFEPSRAGTRMVFTEQVVFLDGYEDHGERIRGTREGLDRLELELHGALPIQ
jgi:uncharacterized protein YndB with AHSA1/START domain